jgi:hypothetical protein
MQGKEGLCLWSMCGRSEMSMTAYERKFCSTAVVISV